MSLISRFKDEKTGEQLMRTEDVKEEIKVSLYLQNNGLFHVPIRVVQFSISFYKVLGNGYYDAFSQAFSIAIWTVCD